jgi:hypothetical protein
MPTLARRGEEPEPSPAWVGSFLEGCAEKERGVKKSKLANPTKRAPASWEHWLRDQIPLSELTTLNLAFFLPQDLARAFRTLFKYGVSATHLYQLAVRNRLITRGKPGPKPRPKLSSSKPERQKKWSEPRYRTLLKLQQFGADILTEQRKPVTDVKALQQAYATKFGHMGLTPGELRDWAKADAKRLPEARRLVRK